MSPALVVLALAFLLIVLARPASAAAPANDDFGNAATASGASGTLAAQTNVDATHETGEPSNHTAEMGSNGSDLGDHSVWYKWTAPSSGLFAFDTFGTDVLTGGVDSVLGVYTGSAVDALTEVNSTQGFSDDYGGNCCDSRVVFSATENTTYYIGVGGCCGQGSDNTGAFKLNWASATRPANDAFASATTISGATGSVSSQSNFDASAESGELSAHQTGGDLGGDSVWYTWQAPSNGVFLFFPFGTNYRGGTLGTAAAAYTGSLGSLTEHAFTANGTLKVLATGGTTYAIGVGGCCGFYNGVYWGNMGSFTVQWSQDTTEPTTSITSTKSGKHAVTFSFTGSDNVSALADLDFECKIDSGSFASCTSPKTFSSITGGLHTVQVRAIDEGGNVDGSPATATIRAHGSPKTTS